jgi:hypothetical protein
MSSPSGRRTGDWSREWRPWRWAAWRHLPELGLPAQAPGTRLDCATRLARAWLSSHRPALTWSSSVAACRLLVSSVRTPQRRQTVIRPLVSGAWSWSSWVLNSDTSDGAIRSPLIEWSTASMAGWSPASSRDEVSCPVAARPARGGSTHGDGHERGVAAVNWTILPGQVASSC